MLKPKFQVAYNAPFTLTFTLACIGASVAIWLTGGAAAALLFSVGGPLNFIDPFFYVRPFLHVLGHANVQHLAYNLTIILLIGPLLEEKHGGERLLLLTGVTAIATALPMLLFLPGRLLGASGVAFALIVLGSYTRAKNGAMPLTFLLVCALYLTQEVYRAFAVNDNVAQFAHLIGGAVGAIAALRWR